MLPHFKYSPETRLNRYILDFFEHGKMKLLVIVIVRNALLLLPLTTQVACFHPVRKNYEGIDSKRVFCCGMCLSINAIKHIAAPQHPRTAGPPVTTRNAHLLASNLPRKAAKISRVIAAQLCRSSNSNLTMLTVQTRPPFSWPKRCSLLQQLCILFYSLVCIVGVQYNKQ